MSALPTVISWYGGKQKIAREIISVFSEHRHYVEVFFGGGAIFFLKPKCPINTINDINKNLVNLYVQIRDHYEELSEKVYWTLYSREEYDKFNRLLQETGLQNLSDIDRAFVYLYVIKGSFNSMVGVGFGSGVTTNTATFSLDLIPRMKACREKLDGVIIENQSFEYIVNKFSKYDKDVMMYLDPPYYVTLKEAKYYEYAISEFQHNALAAMLSTSKCKWVLSYDDVPEIVELYKEFNIMRLKCKYSPGHDNQIKEIDELIITNYISKKPQIDIFDSQEMEVEIEEITDEERDTAVNFAQIKREQNFEEQSKLEKIRNESRADFSSAEQADLFPS
jgi:DNA adenine methylase